MNRMDIYTHLPQLFLTSYLLGMGTLLLAVKGLFSLFGGTNGPVGCGLFLNLLLIIVGTTITSVWVFGDALFP
jgi:hypothetical protein